MLLEEGDSIAVYKNDERKNGEEIAIGEVKGFQDGEVEVLIVDSDELKDGEYSISRDLVEKIPE